MARRARRAASPRIPFAAPPPGAGLLGAAAPPSGMPPVGPPVGPMAGGPMPPPPAAPPAVNPLAAAMLLNRVRAARGR